MPFGKGGSAELINLPNTTTRWISMCKKIAREVKIITLVKFNNPLPTASI